MLLQRRTDILTGIVVFTALIAFSLPAAAGLTYLGSLNGFDHGQASPMVFTDELVAVNGDTATHIWRKDDLGSLPVFVGPPDIGRQRNQVGLERKDNYVFAGAYGYKKETMGSLITLDVSDPTNISVANVWEPEGIKFGRLIRRGDILYSAFHFIGLATVDITDPLNPQFMDVYGTIEDEFNGTDNIALYGDYVFAGTNEGRVDIYDVADPYGIQKVGSIDNGCNRWISIYNSHLYVGHERGIAYRIVDIYDISDMENIHQVGHYDAHYSATCHSFAFQGDYAFFVENYSYPWDRGSFGVHMIDISDPTNPLQVDFCDTSSLGQLYGDLGGCGIDGDRLYVPNYSRNMIMVFEISHVPEPSTWAMILMALGGAGVSVCRRLRMNSR